MPIKILVVDDEIQLQVLIQQRFRRKIQADNYRFRFATTGYEALAAIREESDVDVLLLDINMPDMDGLTLLSRLPDLVPTSRAVMISAYGDMANVRTAMNRGAFDFVLKPIDFQDLELTIEKTAQYVGQLRESIHAKVVAELKARFFDNITHEFRTPLSLIIAPVDTLLQNPRYDEFTRRSLFTVRRNAHQLLNLINQLLDLAKLEANSLPIVEWQGDVVPFLEEVVSSFGAIAEQKGLNLTFTTNVRHQSVLFDADKWQKIIANLLSNAIKFTPVGGSIAVNCVLGQTQLTLTVADTGIGIAHEHLSHIFDRFYQVHTSLTRAYEGSGIGLALAYELTQRLGGQLWVESQPEVGTTFTVELPLQSVTEPLPTPAMTQSPPVPYPFVAPPMTETTDASLPWLLLVEDNTELLSFLAESLAGEYRILTAANGREGFEVAQRELPDVVVSDVMMPEMDGYQLTHRLKTDPATDHIAIVLLTAKTALQSRRDGLTEGADDYLTKPFDLLELQLRLRNIITRQQKLRSYYQRQLDPTNVVPTSVEPESNEIKKVQDVFLTKLDQIIESHLDDSVFRVEQLADAVAMSLRTLTRKLTMLTGVSPARLIRTHRLRRATELLRAGHSVAETAYLVGFDHPSNFATAFKEMYQQTPTEFVTIHTPKR